MLFVCVTEIGAVEAADGDGEDELQEAEDGVEDQDWEGCGAAGADGAGGLLVEAGECHFLISSDSLCWGWVGGWVVCMSVEVWWIGVRKD